MEVLAFYILAGVAVVSALLVVTRVNPIASALWLVVCFFAFAGLYVTLSAHFVAAIQILLYAGAIMVLFIFVIMLLNLGADELKRRTLQFRNVIGAFFVLYLTLLLVLGLFKGVSGGAGVATATDFGYVSPIGRLLFTKYLIPFEVTSVLLLVAIVGSVVMGKRKI